MAQEQCSTLITYAKNSREQRLDGIVMFGPLKPQIDVICRYRFNGYKRRVQNALSYVNSWTLNLCKGTCIVCIKLGMNI